MSTPNDSPSIPGLYTYDWRYRVGFDLRLADDICDEISKIDSSPERHLLQELFRWSQDFVSIDVLLDKAIAGDLSAGMLQAVRKDKLLHVPNALKPALESKLKTLQDAGAVDRAAILKDLIQVAQSRPYLFKQVELAQITFGGELPDLLSAAATVESVKLPQQVVTDDEAKTIVANFSESLRSNRCLREVLARYPLPNYQTVFTEASSGYAEYWPRELSANKGSDQLVIYLSQKTRNRDALLSTLVHEIYPGHGLFYELVRGHASFIDHGALSLVEGWATWCDWNFAPKEYGAYAKAARQRSLRTLAPLTANSVESGIRQTIAENEEINTWDERLMLSFQYPGFAECYALGGLWFSNRLANGNFIGFFEEIEGRPWGDFFRIWSKTDST